MAENLLTQQSYTKFLEPYKNPVSISPVSIGPKPTPTPPKGVIYTPQYSGSTTFNTKTATPYTQTPQGAAELKDMQTNTGTLPPPPAPSPSTNQQSSSNNFLEFYKGWNPDQAARDFYDVFGGDIERLKTARGVYDTSAQPTNPLLSKDYSSINLGESSTTNNADSSGVFDEIYAAAQAGNQSAIDMINSQYGQNESELNRQLGMTDTYQGNDLATLLSQFNKANTETDTQRTLAKQTVDTETGKAADQARMTQKQNRNVLRALGILGSTYAAENLAAPINQFDKQKAELVNWGTKRMGELENYANEKRDEYDRLTNEVKTKYGELREKIMADLRYNNQQKADALKAATAGAQQNLAQLNMQKAQYEQQIQQYSQSLTTQIAQMLMNKAPNAKLDDIAKQSIAFSNQLTNTNPNVAIYQGPEKKNSLTGV